MATSNRNLSSLVWVRRVLFVTVLLSIGPITVCGFDLGYNHPSRAGIGVPPAIWRIFGTFMWGADSIGIVLAVWLAGRVGVWGTWSGRARAVAYVAAYSYGRMLFSATQDWNHRLGLDGLPGRDGEYVPFRWPGVYLDDYARPALDLLTVLMLVWLLLPIFKLGRGGLAEKPPDEKKAGSFSLGFFFGWFTASSVVLLWIRFLTWEGIAPRTAYTSMNPVDALTEYLVEYLPSQLIVVVAAMLIVAAWSGRWWWPVIAFIVALLVDGWGHELLYFAIEQIRGSDAVGGNVLTGDPIEQWSYLVGRSASTWVAFGVARVLGVSFHRLRNKDRIPIETTEAVSD